MLIRMTPSMLILASLFASGPALGQDDTTDAQARVSPEERQARREAMRERWESLSEEERAAIREERRLARESRREAMRERIENMSEEEREALRERMRERRADGPRRGRFRRGESEEAI
jgi:hypothetical protein